MYLQALCCEEITTQSLEVPKYRFQIPNKKLDWSFEQPSTEVGAMPTDLFISSTNSTTGSKRESN